MAVTISGLALIACTYGLARYAYGLFLPAFRDEFHLSGALSGAIAAGGLIAYCVAAALAHRLVGSGRAQLAATLAGVLAALGCAGVAVAPSPGLLSASVLVAGSGAGLASPALVALVASAVPVRRRARAQAIVNAGTGAGVLVSGPVALLLGEQWRAAWLSFVVLTVVATAAVLTATAHLPAPGTAPAGRHPTGPLLGRLRSPIAAAGLIGVGSSAVWTFGYELVVPIVGAGSVGSILFWTALGAAGLGGALVGDAVQRWAITRTWSLLAMSSSLATAVLGLSFGDAAVGYACAIAFGASYVALTGVLIAWGAALTPASAAGATATLFIALTAGQALGALLVGVLLDTTDPRVAFGIAAVITVASAVPAIRPGSDTGSVRPSSRASVPS